MNRACERVEMDQVTIEERMGMDYDVTIKESTEMWMGIWECVHDLHVLINNGFQRLFSEIKLLCDGKQKFQSWKSCDFWHLDALFVCIDMI